MTLGSRSWRFTGDALNAGPEVATNPRTKWPRPERPRPVFERCAASTASPTDLGSRLVTPELLAS